MAAPQRGGVGSGSSTPQRPLPSCRTGGTGAMPTPSSPTEGLPRPKRCRRAQSPPAAPPNLPLWRSPPRRWQRRRSRKPNARRGFRAAEPPRNKQGCWQRGWHPLGVAERGPLLPPRPLQLLAALPALRGAHKKHWGRQNPVHPASIQGCPYSTRGPGAPYWEHGDVLGEGLGSWAAAGAGDRMGHGEGCRGGGGDRGRLPAAPACVGSAMCL